MNTLEKQNEQATTFYREALESLNDCGAGFLLGGAFALAHYTGIYRDTKDLDIFCKPSDYPTILKYFADKGFKTEVTDARWLAKIYQGEYYVDVIFNTPNNICTVDDTWLAHGTPCEFAGVKIKALSAEELIWCKVYVQNRDRYDGADVNHVMLKYGEHLDWDRLLNLFERDWNLLFSQILLFQFVYPSEYSRIVPRRVFDNLLQRAQRIHELPDPVEKICRGPFLDQSQYAIDILEWKFKLVTMSTV